MSVAVLIEDDRQIRRFVRSALEAEGWQVHEADTLKRGLIDAASRKPDLVVFDLGLPDGDGVNGIRQLRGWSTVPIIVLSARSAEEQKIEALDAGADDYLAKPFGVGELLARARANIRRQRSANEEPLVSFGDVRVDLASRVVTRSGEEVHLTPVEYRLLATMVANAGRVLTHRQLLRDVWGPARTDSAHYLRVYMGHLRAKLERDPAQPAYLLTETGVGYRLRI